MAKMLPFSCLLLLGLSVQAEARCSGPFIRTFDNQTVDGHVTVNSGASCNIRLRNSPGPMFSAEIVQRPSNGSVSVGGSNRIVYRSRAGFVGTDTFSYARRGQNTAGSSVVRTVRISVTVTP
jgi:hypothetical protein